MIRRKPQSGIPVARLVVVNTKDQRAFVGYLIASYPDSLVLREARTLPGKEKIVGDVVIPSDNVSWIQADVPAHMMED